MSQADLLRMKIAHLVGHVDYDLLRRICKMETPDVLKLAKTLVGADGDQYGFTDNNSKILAVCHADYVANIGRHFGFCHVDDWDTLVFSPQLDDRLGVYTILYVLPALLKTRFDILITDKEEIGQSTAGLFKTDKQYNWMFSFDRRENQTVMYKFDTCMRPSVSKHFGTPGVGSFSDICRLGHLGCGGFNVATGYSKEHSETCFASMKQWAKSVINFIGFYNEYKDTHFAFKEPVYTTSSYGGYSHRTRSPFVEWFKTTSTGSLPTKSSESSKSTGVRRISLMDQALGRDGSRADGNGKCMHCKSIDSLTSVKGGVACTSCLNKLYYFCAECSDFVLRSKTVPVSVASASGPSRRICRDCARVFNNPIQEQENNCSICGEEFGTPLEETVWFNDQAIGPECARYKEARCNICGRYETLDHLRAWTRDSGMLNVCPKCDSRLFKKYFRDTMTKNPFDEIEKIEIKYESEISDKMTCSKCHKKVLTGDHFGGVFFCKECVPKVSFECADCGSVYLKKRSTKVKDGETEKLVCPICVTSYENSLVTETREVDDRTETPSMEADVQIPCSNITEQRLLP